jgi:hypothetical protein
VPLSVALDAGCVACTGRVKITIWPFFSTAIFRKSTERKYQPEATSPTCRRTRLLVVWSRTNATFRGIPTAVPMSVNGGGSGAPGGGGGASATGMGGGGGTGGRLEAEKIGRSRVADSKLIGIPQSGLAPGGTARGAGFFSAVPGLVRSTSFARRLAPAAWPMAPFKEKRAIAPYHVSAARYNLVIT